MPFGGVPQLSIGHKLSGHSHLDYDIISFPKSKEEFSLFYLKNWNFSDKSHPKCPPDCKKQKNIVYCYQTSGKKHQEVYSMVSLRNFTNADAKEFQQKQATTMSLDELKAIFAQWGSKNYAGKYYEMFAVVKDGEIVGSISLYQLSKSVVSCGPEVFAAYRKQGIGKEAMLLAMDIAKNMGYKVVSQQIGRNNTASIALHEKLGFETDEYIYRNKKGNEVLIYIKPL